MHRLTQYLEWKWSEYSSGSLFLLFHKMCSGRCSYLGKKLSLYTLFIVVLHIHSQISPLAAFCKKERCWTSATRPETSSLYSYWEVLLCLTGSLRMSHFTYYESPSSHTSACLADNWRVSLYALQLAVRMRHLTGPTLRTLLDLVDSPAFSRMEISISGVRIVRY